MIVPPSAKFVTNCDAEVGRRFSTLALKGKPGEVWMEFETFRVSCIVHYAFHLHDIAKKLV